MTTGYNDQLVGPDPTTEERNELGGTIVQMTRVCTQHVASLTELHDKLQGHDFTRTYANLVAGWVNEFTEDLTIIQSQFEQAVCDDADLGQVKTIHKRCFDASSRVKEA